jgi:hypothetical protein
VLDGWTLGTVAGENSVTASSGLLPAVTIRALAQADVAARLLVVREPAAATLNGVPLSTQPVVQLVDRFDNAATQAGVLVSAVVVSGAVTVSNGTTVTGSDGRAVFTGLTLSGPEGPYTLEFQAAGLTSGRAAAPTLVGAGACSDAGAGAVSLDLQLGQLLRVGADAVTAPSCLSFDIARAAGQQYLLLFENMPQNASYSQGLFDMVPRSGNQFAFTVRGAPAGVASPAAAAFRQVAFPAPATAATAAEWDFGDGVIREGQVQPPPPGTPGPQLLKRGVRLDLLAAQADPAVGDTITVYLEGISRLGIPNGEQKAVIRFLSDQLIFAEDVRLPTLLRDGSTEENPAYNSPMALADMQEIARQYASYARVQGDRLFEGRYNGSVESRSPANRVLAVHTLMYANNIWGYTYSSSHYFAFDYWVGNTGGKTKGLAQHPIRIADVLFMHEIAHLRHWGLLERASRTGQRGNLWLVEGFARFSERLPIAHRLLGSETPARTGNVVLRRVPEFGNASYFDDVPTYLQAGSPMVAGYANSSFVFDYLADQVALRGGDPIAALRAFVINAGSPANLDAAIAALLPDVASFGELFTRARIALYTDDYPPGSPLPPWTQYHQYQLRASRPTSQPGADPRNFWPRVVPGQAFATTPEQLSPGAAAGVLIDGSAAAASGRITIEANRVANGVISILRVR